MWGCLGNELNQSLAAEEELSGQDVFSVPQGCVKHPQTGQQPAHFSLEVAGQILLSQHFMPARIIGLSRGPSNSLLLPWSRPPYGSNGSQWKLPSFLSQPPSLPVQPGHWSWSDQSEVRGHRGSWGQTASV